MPLTVEERGELVEFYLETKSIVKTQRAFQRHFGVREAPGRKTVWRIVQKFRTDRNLHNLNKGRSGRHRGARTPENIEAVRLSATRSPKKSCRRRSQELSLSRMSIVRILKLDLKLFPHHIQVKHKLTTQDQRARVAMCNWFNDKMEEDEDWIDNVWFSDEAHFHLDGHVNSKNCVFWGTQPPQEVLQRPLHSSKVTAWCAMNSKTIIGPYWFEDADGRTVTVNQENYRTVIRKFYASVRRRRGIVIDRQWFMQDGATPHTANATLELLRQKFGDRVISRRTDIPWAAHSPDLNPLDFFLWGYAKDNVYADNPQTLQDLKTAITRFIRAIPADMCKRVIGNFAVRLNECLNRRGAHIEKRDIGNFRKNRHNSDNLS